MICAICKDTIKPDPRTGWDQGNDAWPLKPDERCCDSCNILLVVPARIKGINAALFKGTKAAEEREQ